ncbi:hypothetical protein RhiirA5_500417 [Rhizophagus irregularis]|uniref:Uncharacterized protein n=1 Tax=Rhizophagus irregularis TaxID=588596 RepID=A0A2N0PLZ4_9GLOM|nr:hypothetical protein RhiirA5_500417 [Rhizophagus irregularis]
MRQVIEISHIANLNILSFGADGARSEFNAQSIIMNEPSNFLEYKDFFYKIHFKAPMYNGNPFIRIQDLKHAKKGLMQILVNGELCDAYLNRTIDHKTRIEMYGRIPALEHVFGISRRILPDFNFYKFFKIQQRVSYRDKISRAGIIDTNRERNSAAGYIFDIDECARVAFDGATSLAKYIHIDRPGNTALEITRILSDPQNENSQLHEDENLDDYEEVEITQELPSVGNHEAFSRNLKANYNHLHQTTIDENNNKINENVINKLITEIMADNKKKTKNII